MHMQRRKYSPRPFITVSHYAKINAGKKKTLFIEQVKKQQMKISEQWPSSVPTATVNLLLLISHLFGESQIVNIGMVYSWSEFNAKKIQQN